jgi:lincosamide nucleotidyltransferase A/C/D/E
VTEAEAIDVLDRLEAAGVDVWVDGGWGIDALLGRQTRAHRDLDLVVRNEQLRSAFAALSKTGFTHAHTEVPGLPARLVLRDAAGRQVDFHPIEFDDAGDGRQNLGDGRTGIYPAEGMTGRGAIGGRHVRCLTAETQLAHHSVYELRPHERRDVELLAAAFGFE